MPTTNYTWSFPTLGQESWHSAFVSAINSIALAVNSVERGTWPHAAIVISAFPATSFQIVWNASGVLDGVSQWAPFSSAPFGAAVGAFSILGSGTGAFIEAFWSWCAGSRSSGTNQTEDRGYLRAVIAPGSLLLGRSESRWLACGPAFTAFSYPHTAHFIDVLSLGPGTYGITMEWKFYTAGVAPDSRAYLWHPGLGLVVKMQEAILR